LKPDPSPALLTQRANEKNQMTTRSLAAFHPSAAALKRPSLSAIPLPSRGGLHRIKKLPESYSFSFSFSCSSSILSAPNELLAGRLSFDSSAVAATIHSLRIRFSRTRRSTTIRQPTPTPRHPDTPTPRYVSAHGLLLSIKGHIVAQPPEQALHY
jgi:hypothetical protein